MSLRARVLEQSEGHGERDVLEHVYFGGGGYAGEVADAEGGGPKDLGGEFVVLQDLEEVVGDLYASLGLVVDLYRVATRREGKMQRIRTCYYKNITES